jgi:hypothetical protein
LLLSAAAYAQTQPGPQDTPTPEAIAAGASAQPQQAPQDAPAPEAVPAVCDAHQELIATKVGGPKFNVHLLVEDFSGSSAFRFAAAEVIRAYFSERIAIASDSPFVLYITGTDLEEDRQTYDVSLRVYIRHPLMLDTTTKLLTGHFQVADAGASISGTEHYRARKVKEDIHQVLSDFLSAWDKEDVLK